MSFPLIFMSIFAAVGAIFATVGFVLERSERSLIDNGVRANVEVVDLVRTRGNEGGTMWKSVFEVVSGPHEGVRYTSRMATSPARHAVGHRGEGLYNPSDGRIALADGSGLRFAMIFSSLGLGLLCGLGIYILRTRSI